MGSALPWTVVIVYLLCRPTPYASATTTSPALLTLRVAVSYAERGAVCPRYGLDLQTNLTVDLEYRTAIEAGWSHLDTLTEDAHQRSPSLPLSDDVQQIQFRLIQREHGGGKCNCWRVNEFSVHCGEAEFNNISNCNSTALCGGSASLPRAVVYPPLLLEWTEGSGSGAVHLNSYCTMAETENDSMNCEVTEKVATEAYCNTLQPKSPFIKLEFVLGFVSKQNSTSEVKCNRPVQVNEGIEVAMRSLENGTLSEWLPLAYFIYDFRNSGNRNINTINITHYTVMKTDETIDIRGYTVPLTKYKKEMNNIIEVCDSHVLQSTSFQFRWLQTCYLGNHAIVDRWYIDNVNITFHEDDSEWVCLQDDFNDIENLQLNMKLWELPRNGNVTRDTDCVPAERQGILHFSTETYINAVSSRIVRTKPFYCKNFTSSTPELLLSSALPLSTASLPASPSPSPPTPVMTHHSSPTPSSGLNTSSSSPLPPSHSNHSHLPPSLTSASSYSSLSHFYSHTLSTPTSSHVNSFFSSSHSSLPLVDPSTSTVPQIDLSLLVIFASSYSASVTPLPTLNTYQDHSSTSHHPASPVLSPSFTSNTLQNHSFTSQYSLYLISPPSPTLTTHQDHSSYTASLVLSPSSTSRKLQDHSSTSLHSIPFISPTSPTFSTPQVHSSASHYLTSLVPSPSSSTLSTLQNYSFISPNSVSPHTPTLNTPQDHSSTSHHPASLVLSPLFTSRTLQNHSFTSLSLISPHSPTLNTHQDHSSTPQYPASLDLVLSPSRKLQDHSSTFQHPVSPLPSPSTILNPLKNELERVTAVIANSFILTRIYNMVQSDPQSALEELHSVIPNDTNSSLDATAVVFLLAEILNASDSLHTDEDYAQLFLDTCSEIIVFIRDTPVDEIGVSGSSLLLLLEEFSFTLALGSLNSLESDYIAMEVQNMSIMRENSFRGIGRGSSSIDLPPVLLNRALEDVPTVLISSFYFKNISNLLPTNNSNISGYDRLELISPVISSTLRCQPSNCDTENLTEPVVISLSHPLDQMKNSTAICSFWDFGNKIGPLVEGQWSNRGCSKDESLSSASVTVCTCNHLTHFGILLSPTGSQIQGTVGFSLQIIGYIGVSISLLCLAVTTLTFLMLRSLHNMRNFIHINLCINLMTAQLIFIVGINKTSNKVGCQVVAVLLHYFFLVSFMWMLMEGVVLYISLVRVFIEHRRRYLAAFSITSYGLPLLYMGLCVPLGFLLWKDGRVGYGYENACWLRYDTGFIWAFIGPVILILLCNIGFLIMTIRIIYQHQKKQAHKSRNEKAKRWVKVILSLVLVMGLTWIIGVIQFHEVLQLAVGYLFTIFIGLQGMLIFILFVLLSKKVRKAYVNWWRDVSNKSDFLTEKFGGNILFTNNTAKSTSIQNDLPAQTYELGTFDYSATNATESQLTAICTNELNVLESSTVAMDKSNSAMKAECS